jgi:queuine tRNA-ribosyltransferase
MKFEILSANKTTFPRTGIVETAHGSVPTPTYMPVGTFGPVKLLDAEELKTAGASIILGNGFHLESTAGSSVINKLGGLAKFTGWDGPTLTDSGGYQVSYMWRSGTHSLENGERKHKTNSPIEKITDNGARVKSLITGESYWLTPEKAMEIQALMGADIVMAFDQPTFDTDSLENAQSSMRRAHAWIVRSQRHWKELKEREVAPCWQVFFPIIQGGRHVQLRKESARFSVDLDTVGLAIAGESIGIVPAISAETLEMVREILPTEKPLYAMGLGGGPEGFFEGTLRGVDMFDNTSPTRMGRSGLALISPGSGGTPKNHFRFDLTKGCYREDSSAVDSSCGCKTCQKYTRAYLRHLFKIRDPLGMRLVCYHNVWFMCNLGALIREAIKHDSFDSLYRSWLR